MRPLCVDSDQFIDCKSRSFEKLSHLSLSGHALSPIKHLYLPNDETEDRDRELSLLRRIVDEVNAYFIQHFKYN